MQKKFQDLEQELSTQFFERENVVHALLCCLLVKQHVLLLGPPGTAKSALVNSVCRSFKDTTYFSWLLTRFSTPEELFGPVSLSALQQDKFERNIQGKMPLSRVAFLDEIFKANSAILNSLLTLINERTFHNGTHLLSCPLQTVVGASNELPEGEELNALFDRFSFRFWIPYISDQLSLKSMMLGNLSSTKTTIDLSELETAQKDVQGVNFPDSVIDSIIEIKTKLENEGFLSSDRRWKQILSTLRGHCWLTGDQEVSIEHFDILPDLLWVDPKDRSTISQIVGAVSDPISVKALEILDAAKEQIKQLKPLDPTCSAQSKSEWTSQATLLDSTLQAMLRELDQLGQHKKAISAKNQIKKQRENVLKSLTRAFQV